MPRPTTNQAQRISFSAEELSHRSDLFLSTHPTRWASELHLPNNLTSFQCQLKKVIFPSNVCIPSSTQRFSTNSLLRLHCPPRPLIFCFPLSNFYLTSYLHLSLSTNASFLLILLICSYSFKGFFWQIHGIFLIMVASSRGFTSQLELKLSTLFISYGLAPSKKKRMCFPRDPLTMLSRISCCCSEPVVPVRRGSGSGKNNEKVEDWRFDSKKSPHRVRVQASSGMPFASAQYVALI